MSHLSGKSSKSKRIKDILADFNQYSYTDETKKTFLLSIIISDILSSFKNNTQYNPIIKDFIQDDLDLEALKEIKQIILNNYEHLDDYQNSVRDAFTAISLLEESVMFKELDSKSSQVNSKEEDRTDYDNQISNGTERSSSPVYHSFSSMVSQPLAPPLLLRSPSITVNLPLLRLPPAPLAARNAPRFVSRRVAIASSNTESFSLSLTDNSEIGVFRGRNVYGSNMRVMNSRPGGLITHFPNIYVQSWIRVSAMVLLENDFSTLVFINANLCKDNKALLNGYLSFLDVTQDILDRKIGSKLDDSPNKKYRGGSGAGSVSEASIKTASLTKESFLANVLVCHGKLLQKALYQDFQKHYIESSNNNSNKKGKKILRQDSGVLDNSLKYPFILLTELLNDLVRYFPNEPNLDLNQKPDIAKCKKLAADKVLKSLVVQGLVTQSDYNNLYDKFAKSEKAVINFISNLVYFIELEEEVGRQNTFSLSSGLVCQQRMSSPGQDFFSSGSEFLSGNVINLEELVREDRKALLAVLKDKLLYLNFNINNGVPLLVFEQQGLCKVLPGWYRDLRSDMQVLQCVESKFQNKDSMVLRQLDPHNYVKNNLHKTIFILVDLSGSMSQLSVANDHNSKSRMDNLKVALKSTLDSLKAKDVRVSIIGFNDEYINISGGFINLKDISEDNYNKSIEDIMSKCVPNGRTYLHEAATQMCDQIKDLGNDYDPNKTLCITITDGACNNGDYPLSDFKRRLQESASLGEDDAVPLFCSIAISDQANKNQLKDFMDPFLSVKNCFAQKLFEEMKESGTDNLDIKEVSDLFIISDDADKLDFYLENILVPFVGLEFPEVNINLELEVKVDDKMFLDNNSIPRSCEINLKQQDLLDCKLLATYDAFKDFPHAKGNICIKVSLIPESEAGKSGGKAQSQKEYSRLKCVLSLVSSEFKQNKGINYEILKKLINSLSVEKYRLSPTTDASASFGGFGSSMGRTLSVPASRRSSTQATPSASSVGVLRLALARSVTQSQSSQSSKRVN